MKRWVLDNAFLKALALALAILLWYSLSGSRRQRVSERGYVVPLTVVNVPPDMVIASPLPDTVDVRLTGPFAAIRLADPGKMEAVMDLTGSSTGDRIYKLSGDDINVPDDLEVVSISPPAVHIRLEMLVQRTVRIIPRLTGGTATARVIPPTATISGPASQIAKTSSIPTDPISLTGQTTDFITPATLAAEPNIRLINPRDGVVSVHVHWKTPR